MRFVEYVSHDVEREPVRPVARRFAQCAYDLDVGFPVRCSRRGFKLLRGRHYCPQHYKRLIAEKVEEAREELWPIIPPQTVKLRDPQVMADLAAPPLTARRKAALDAAPDFIKRKYLKKVVAP
jgi:hypothetical protein